jgi:hypothetical protein
MANLITLTRHLRLKRPAPFMLSALNMNGAAFYINALFLPIGSLLFARPKPLKFTEQRIASESYETVGVPNLDNNGRKDIIIGRKIWP